ncbi:MAG TPA: hypothetical protein VL916_01715 [Ilumatobacteraceae bacterium]|nr:hypothetical protein [Ilumatobacteraceae bacterium]
MHPIERLRHIARSSGGDQRVLVQETALALRALGHDPAELVVSCRRIVERHPTSGPLWWLCAHLLTASDPGRAGRELAARIDADPTPEVLIEGLPEGAAVCVVGWPDLAGEAALRRGDLSVFAVDALDQGRGFARRLDRAGVTAELVDAGGVAAAVLAADIVLVEALAASPTELLAVPCSRAAASVAYCSEVPLWAVVGVGRCLPNAAFASMVERVADVRVPWMAEAEPLPLGLASHVVRCDGVYDIGDAVLAPECPLAQELLRSANA